MRGCRSIKQSNQYWIESRIASDKSDGGVLFGKRGKSERKKQADESSLVEKQVESGDFFFLSSSSGDK